MTDAARRSVHTPVKALSWEVSTFNVLDLWLVFLVALFRSPTVPLVGIGVVVFKTFE